MTQPHPTLSLVILCYRSEDSAREFTARTLTMMREHGIESFALILVGNFDEGSSDRTPEVVRELAASDRRIRCRAEPKQGMMGWDLRSGLREARGAYIAFIDGDGQMPIGDVGRLFKLIENSEFDLVKTHRMTRADGWKRRVLSTGYNIVFRLLFPGLKARHERQAQTHAARRVREDATHIRQLVHRRGDHDRNPAPQDVDRRNPHGVQALAPSGFVRQSWGPCSSS